MCSVMFNSSLLMKVKEKSDKAGLKLNIQNTKITASNPIISWQIDRETVTDFILGGSKITADDDCSHEIKRHLLLERKAMTKLYSILKSRDITLPTKVWRPSWVRKIPWRRKWQSTLVFLPGKSHGLRRPGGYSPWGHKRIRHDLVTKEQESHTISIF